MGRKPRRSAGFLRGRHATCPHPPARKPQPDVANGRKRLLAASMPRIPLEDNFTDVVGKDRRALQLSDGTLAEKAGVTANELKAVKAGEVRDHAIRGIAKALKLEREALLALARREWYPEQPTFKRGFAMFNTPHEDMMVNAYLVWDTK